ncbi:MAG TPA: immunoglobulin domain-containing protein [Anaerohalosphaeraceae bacterium]|nr:immunoglobulin domain-containing protein [Anaerohalosphaeraceae bacterium]HQG06886.1 immunoglobulin domain-containing protein [Anaerohalosphaeraceae bacterium]HQI08549.1 immunoglobulin domain-containing protein [Anaerohalosphaeraceae bacterium]HQJ68847.1 immunoglobulin domain-containing protein [Anaerohalosphaeraceae bacterium]
MMKKMIITMTAAIGMVLAAAAMGAPLKLDMGLPTSGVEPGWNRFLSTDDGTTLFDGVKVTIAGESGWRNRTSAELNGVPNELLWRDFVYSSGAMSITIEGLKPLVQYELSIGAFDIDSKTATPHAADWKVGGETILSTSFGIPGVPLATLVPSAERNYLFSGYAFSDETGKIIMQASASSTNGGGAYAFVNGLVIAPVLWAFEPTPANGAADQPLNTVLSWRTGRDPNNFNMPNPKIGVHYLYFSSDPNLPVSPISISAGKPVEPTASYGPLTLVYDKTYYWRVDEGVYVNGVLSGPSDPATIVGKVWSFETLKSVPVIKTSPVNTKVFAGGTVQFMTEFTSLSPVIVSWYKDGTPIIPDGRVSIDTTDTSSTLSISDAGLADEGAYSCKVTNAGGSQTITPASLAIARLLAQYQFEQNGDDAVGDADGTPINGMAYTEGIVTIAGQAWAADPNGSNYFEVPKEKAYPRAGYGKGLEEFTYSFWVKRGTYTGNKTILGTFNLDKNTAMRLTITNTGVLDFYIRQEGDHALWLITPAPVLSEDRWHHVVFTYDQSWAGCYVDGLLVHGFNFVFPSTFVDWQYPMAVLANNVRGTVGEFFPGQVDDLRIYNYRMTPEEIAQLYYEVSGIRPCIYGNPDFDISGPEGTPDCVVNLYDFAAFAASWFESGLFVPAP